VRAPLSDSLGHVAEAPAGDWNARVYHTVAAPHAAWGGAVLDRLRLSGSETVVDAGCGSGRVTAPLLERLPNGHVIAVDVSPAMLAEARTTLADYGARVSFVEVDLVRLDQVLDRTVDAIFSTATLHWIADHDAVFRAFANVLRPGGQLVAQCGGGPNLARLMSATDAVAAEARYRDALAGQDLWRHYYGAADTEKRLLAAGFAEPHAWLEDSPQTFADAAALATFARTVVLSRHVGVLPEALRDAFVEDVVAEIHRREGSYVLDYVRLNLDAQRTRD
jgi:trans-aconitate 2-methyltransferase